MSSVHALTAPPARILIVDDESDNRELLRIVLKWEGFLTTMADSGEEALAAIAEDPPDLVLLDMMMPGLDGCEVTLQMKAKRAMKDIPVLIVSALDDRPTRLRVLRAGAVGFITKPIDRVELCAQVRSILALRTVARVQPGE